MLALGFRSILIRHPYLYAQVNEIENWNHL